MAEIETIEEMRNQTAMKAVGRCREKLKPTMIDKRHPPI
jgi:hypothetical protein